MKILNDVNGDINGNVQITRGESVLISEALKLLCTKFELDNCYGDDLDQIKVLSSSFRFIADHFKG